MRGLEKSTLGDENIVVSSASNWRWKRVKGFAQGKVVGKLDDLGNALDNEIADTLDGVGSAPKPLNGERQ